jgi:hypothetical protein
MAVEQRPVGVEAHCRHCAGWIATVPPGTPWARGRCIKRGCLLYGSAQTVQLARETVVQ